MMHAHSAAWEAAVHAEYPPNDPAKRILSDGQRARVQHALELYNPGGIRSFLATLLMRGVNYEPGWYREAVTHGQASLATTVGQVAHFNSSHGNRNRLELTAGDGDRYRFDRQQPAGANDSARYDVTLIHDDQQIAVEELPPGQVIAHSAVISALLEAELLAATPDQRLA